LSGCKRREHALVGGARLGTQPLPQSFSLRRQVQLTRPPVITIDAPFDQSLRMEPIDDEARIAGVDAHCFRESALVNSWLDLEAKKRPVLQLDHLSFPKIPSGLGFALRGRIIA